MENIPKVLDLVVNNDLCTGCGICIYKCPNKAIEIQWNDYGFLVPKLYGTCEADGACISVCPFNPYPEKEIQTEDELSEIFLKDDTIIDPKIGKYIGIYAGYANEFRLSSSSGGIATFILFNLLENGYVDQIISVRDSVSLGKHYEYTVINSKQELLDTSKTKYFPVTLSTVFSKVNEIQGKIAIVGVACFIKAIRLAQHSEPTLKEKIPFLVGIICGGIKSRFFTDYLANKAGVPKDLYYKPEFRIKDLNSTAGDYSFGCLSRKDNLKSTVRMRTVGDMWGTGLFKSNACDFCDDVTTELADISLGDAWLSPYINDGKGTNVIVTRSKLADQVIREGIESKAIYIEKLSLDIFLSSQKGSFNHRRTGLPYRVKLANKNRKLIPPKRVIKDKAITLDFKFVQFIRTLVRRKSLEVWLESPDSNIFNYKMKRILTFLKLVTSIYHYKQAIFSKGVLRKIKNKIKS